MGIVKISGFDTNREYLSSKETIELIKRHRETGEKRYKDQAAEGNIGLVLSRCKKIKRNTTDLFQVGCIGLMKAIDYFDIDRGVKFSTYAVPMIDGEIKRYKRDKMGDRVQRRLQDMIFRYYQHKEKHPTKPDNEIANELDINLGELQRVLSFRSKDSINRELYSDEGSIGELGDIIPSSVDVESEVIDRIDIERAMAKLKPKEIKVVQYRYFKDKTQIEIGQELGVSQAQVSRTQKKALNKIRKLIQKEEQQMKLNSFEKKVKKLLGGAVLKEHITDKEEEILNYRLIKGLSYRKLGERVGMATSTAYKKYDEILKKIPKGINESENKEHSEQVTEEIKEVVEKPKETQVEVEKNKDDEKKIIKQDSAQGFFLLVNYDDGMMDCISSKKMATLKRIRKTLVADQEVDDVKLAVEI